MKNEELFDAAVAAVRDEPIDAKTLAAAQERVLVRLTHQVADAALTESPKAATTSAPDAVAEHQIHGCAGFRALLPAYVAAALTEPKRVLVEDHTRECVGCRRVLNELRHGAPRSAQPVAAPRAPRLTRGPWRLAMAAGLAGVALLSGTLLFRSGVFAPSPVASVQSIDGELAIVANSGIRPAVAGERFGGDTGATAIRTGGNSGAVVTLADGSKVELAERSELALGKRWDGTVLKLARGSVIVEAAEQRRGHLYVETGDCQVAVVGTIFSVNAGAKGSRVSVIEGEVRVRQGAERAVLRSGDQLATGRYLGAVPVAEEISWSRNAADYRERLAALKALGRELDQTFVSAGARTSTRLLDLTPEGTSVYAALPNLSQTLAEAWSLVQQRATENPALADWWNERFPDGADEQISEAIADLSRFGAELGPEIAVTVELRENDDADPDARPVIFATILDPAHFSPILDEQIAAINAHSASEGDDLFMRRIAEPAEASSNGQELLIWTAGDLLVASPSVGRLREVAAILESGANPFTTTPLHDRLAGIYGEGTDWLLGVDLASVIAEGTATSSDPENEALVLDRLGFADLDHLVIDRRDGDGADGAGQNRASLTFREDRHGVASWLAAPAPLGAFEFVSPAAHVAVAGLLKNPAEMLDDALAFAAAAEGAAAEDGALHGLAEVEARLGISIRQDLAASLGGDFAFAFDGPWLPQPSWKLVLEVSDAARLHETMQALVEAWNEEAQNPGPEETPRPALRLTRESIDGRFLFTLALEAEGSGESSVIANGLFVDGYLLLGPSRALLLEAADQRAAGVTLASSQAFLDLVPRDGEANFSALVYQNMGDSLGQLGELVHRATARAGEGAGAADAAEQADGLSELLGDGGPGLAVAYAEGREISFVTRGLRGPLGLSFEGLLAIGGMFHPPAEAPEEEVEEQSAPAPDAETRTRVAA
jgi:ferric-dicitrate binding protein FerR (iron transport regulator)